MYIRRLEDENVVAVVFDWFVFDGEECAVTGIQAAGLKADPGKSEGL